MLPLPIDATLPALLATLRTHNAAILTAPPGAGKTTRVPPAIIQAEILPKDALNLIMLQPRRVAARAAAQRIADEQHWQLGHQVGYHIRFEKRYAPYTRIRVLTEAILTRILLHDPYLDKIGCVILDEFHERNLHTDLALAFLRELQSTVRPDLKLLIMSATLDAHPVAHFLHNAPILHSEGRSFPLTTHHRPAKNTPLEQHIPLIIEEALQNPDHGDLLIFLPGKKEIDQVAQALLRSSFIVPHSVLPLHGSLTAEDQQRALAPLPGRTKILLATNIAETSLTIDGVRTVIDSGLARIASFDPDRGMDRLDLSRISQASATQRAGRAARQAPGTCFRLWPEQDHKHLAPFTTPEIQRVDLAPAALAVHAWGAKDLHTFAWFEPPETSRIDAANTLLHLLNALHEKTLTPLGRAMLPLPLHPRLARLLLAAKGTPLQEDALTLATLLSDDTQRPTSLLDLHLPPHLHRTRDQLASTLRSLPQNVNETPENTESTEKNSKKINPQTSVPSVLSVVTPGRPQTITDLLLLAHPDRIARRRDNDPYAAIMVGGIGIRIAKESLTPALAATNLLLALNLHHDPHNRKAEALVRTAIPLDEQTLQRLFPTALHTETALTYDDQKQKVIAATRYFFHDLLLHEDPHGHVDPTPAGPILATALAPQARNLFLQNETAANLLARIALLHHHLPELNFPNLDDAALTTLLTTACQNKRSLSALTESSALQDAIRAALPYPLDRHLDQLAPETYPVPSGSKIKIHYQLPPLSSFIVQHSSFPAPILPVRLQELFGLLDTPRIANNRIPLLLHLLSPGYKPIQITQDLPSFWANAYFEVRKDLRTRYPKHAWPENPLTAPPIAKGRSHK